MRDEKTGDLRMWYITYDFTGNFYRWGYAASKDALHRCADGGDDEGEAGGKVKSCRSRRAEVGHGGRSQNGADRVPPDAVRRSGRMRRTFGMCARGRRSSWPDARGSWDGIERGGNTATPMRPVGVDESKDSELPDYPGMRRWTESPRTITE